MSQEELSALQRAMLMKQANDEGQDEGQMGIDDAIPEEEEIESQQVT
jgi:hypothetical protein